MVSEYTHTQDKMFLELLELEPTFNSSFSGAIWDFNLDQLNAILAGMHKIDLIAGILIFDNDKTNIAHIGTVPPTDDFEGLTRKKTSIKAIHIVKPQTRELFGGLIEYRFPIIHHSEENNEVVGNAFIYSDEKTILRRVKHGFLLILINSVIKTIFLWIVFLVATSKIIIKPLNTLIKITKEIDPNNPILNEEQAKNISTLKEREDELGILSNVYNHLLDEIADDLEKIKNFNASLEEKVALRTAELAAQNNKIKTMLINITQGILTFEADLLIQSEYSLYLEEIFQQKELAGLNILDILFEDSNIGSDGRDQVYNALFACIGEDSFNYDVNNHLLIAEMQRHGRDLELTWEPIYDDNDNVQKIMLVIRDVTDLKVLQNKAQENKKEIDTIGEILNIGLAKSISFLEEANQFLRENEQLIKEDIEGNIKVMFRNFHTLKGNARTFNFLSIVDNAHEAEAKYTEITNKMASYTSEELLADIETVRKDIQYYEQIITGKLGSIGGDDFHDFFKNVLEEVKDGNIAESWEIVRAYSQEGVAPLKWILRSEVASAPEIAQSLGKEVPQFNWKTELRYTAEEGKLLQKVFTHMIRNSLDHGVETGDVRKAKGKDPVGAIIISDHSSDKGRHITIEDDGAGLNLGFLATKSPEGVKQTDLEIAENIFTSGVSSKTEVSDISGRGVGMDAVKAFLNNSGGDINISFTAERNKDGFRPFRFDIFLPHEIKSKVS